jgi:hypothetical protein
VPVPLVAFFDRVTGDIFDQLSRTKGSSIEIHQLFPLFPHPFFVNIPYLEEASVLGAWTNPGPLFTQSSSCFPLFAIYFQGAKRSIAIPYWCHLLLFNFLFWTSTS